MNIGILIGSVREGRLGYRVGKWIENLVTADNHTPLLIDLQTFSLPFFDEAQSPRFNPNRKPPEPIQSYLNQMRAADGYIIVTPEYNRAPAAVLKNAIDHIGYEAAHKPSFIVSYSNGPSGGLAANMQFRSMLPGIEVVPTPTITALLSVQTLLNESGELVTEQPHAAGILEKTKQGLRELYVYAEALHAVQEKLKSVKE